MIKFRDDVVRGEIVRAVIVGKYAYITKLTEERASPGNFQNTSVIALVSRVEEGAIEPTRFGHIKAFLGFEHLRQLVAPGKEGKKLWEGLLTITDEYMIEHLQLTYFASLIKGPGDRASENKRGAWV